MKRTAGQDVAIKANHRQERPAREQPPKAQVGLESVEEVQGLLRRLPMRERQVVRLFYLQGRSYEEISTELHIPVNSIGPILSRARRALRRDLKNNARAAAVPEKQQQPKPQGSA
jgi:RNA polymerase sigma-70 factor (ECF subfamily)